MSFIENPVAIERQIRWVETGKKRCCLVSLLNDIPDSKVQLFSFQTIDGTYLWKEPCVGNEVRDAIDNDTIGLLLGYGIPRKPELEDVLGVLTLMDEKGIEILSVVTDREHYCSVYEALRKFKERNDTIRLIQNFQDLVRIHYQRLILASDYVKSIQ